MNRVVLDTNVVASACFWRGTGWKCLEAWVAGRFTALVSPPMLAEYSEVFERLRQRYSDKPRVDWVPALRDNAELVFPAVRIPDAFGDMDDAVFAECAVAGEADYLVSGDKECQRAVSVGFPCYRPRGSWKFCKKEVGEPSWRRAMERSLDLREWQDLPSTWSQPDRRFGVLHRDALVPPTRR